MSRTDIVKKTVALLLIAILLSGLLSIAVLFLSACKNDSPIESNVIVHDGGVTVRWEAVKGAKEYKIYYAPSRFSEYRLESSQKQTEFDGEDIYGYYRVDAFDKQDELLSTETYSYEAQLFGSNVGIYSPLDDMSKVQSEIDTFCKQTDEFYDGRFAAIFKAGDYNQLDLQLRYYSTYSGLGKLPTDTVLGKLNTYATQPGGNATRDFWRGIENLTVNDNVQWTVSQATRFCRGTSLLTALFRGAEHKQAEDLTKPVEAVTDEITPIPEEEPESTVETDFSEVLDDFDKSLAEYRQAKADMERLGFTDYDEYLDYLAFTQRKAARKSDIEM